MNLKIVVGRAKSGKSNYLYNDAIKKVNDNVEEEILYIVPEQMTYSTERDIIQNASGEGLLNIRVLSFKRLEYIVLDEVGGAKLVDINDYGKIMLLKKICDQSADELTIFKKAMYKEGFLNEFNVFIKELKNNRINAETLDSVDISGLKNEILKNKLSDIKNIYKRIEEISKDNYFDDEDKTGFFINLIEKSEVIRNSHIYIDNFESFVGLRFEIIKKLIMYAKSVTVSVNLDPECLTSFDLVDDNEIFKTTFDTYLGYLKIASDLKTKPEIIKLEKSYIKNPEILHLEQNIFKTSYKKYEEEVSAINITQAANIYNEVNFVCKKIISLIRDKGYRYKDIAVVTSDINSYNIDIKKIFSLYEIPFFMDFKKNIIGNPFIQYIISILDMLIFNFKQQNVIQYLKTGFGGFEYDEAEKLENFIIKYGIEGNRWFKEFKIKDENIKYYEELRQRFENDFLHMKKEFAKAKTAEEITVFLYKIMKQHNVRELIEKKVDEYKHSGMYEQSFLNAQIWNVVINIFEQIILVSEDIEITHIQYKKILETGFMQIELGIIPPTLDKVVIGELDSTFMNNYKAVFLMGANEGVLLSSKEDKGILIDDEKEELKNLGIQFMNTSTYKENKQKHILYKTLTSPSEYLFLSYAFSTDTGKSLEPSIYIDRLLKLIPKIKIYNDSEIGEEIEFVTNSKATLDKLIEHLREYIDGRPIDSIWKNVYKWYFENSEKIPALIYQGLRYKNSVDNIKPDAIEKLYKKILLTASDLENYATCPFKFFLDKGIKPLPRKELKIEFYDIGNIFHKCIEQFTIGIINKNCDVRNSDSDVVYDFMDNCIDAVLSEDGIDGNALEYNERNKYVKEKIKRLLKRAAKTIADQIKAGNFEPKFTEFPISSEIDTSTEFKKVLLEGRADRIDVLELDGKSYINIIDYKSSKREIVLSDVLSGLQLQLFVYLSAILNNKEQKSINNPQIGGLYYFNIDDPYIDADEVDRKNDDYEQEIFKELFLRGYVLEDYRIISGMDEEIYEKRDSDIIQVSLKKDDSISKRSKTLSQDEYLSMLDMAEDKAKDIANNIFSGNIDIKPYKKSQGKTPCSYCQYRTICVFDSSVEGNRYNNIQKKTKDEIFLEREKLKI